MNLMGLINILTILKAMPPPRKMKSEITFYNDFWLSENEIIIKTRLLLKALTGIFGKLPNLKVKFDFVREWQNLTTNLIVVNSYNSH